MQVSCYRIVTTLLSLIIAYERRALVENASEASKANTQHMHNRTAYIDLVIDKMMAKHTIYAVYNCCLF